MEQLLSLFNMIAPFSADLEGHMRDLLTKPRLLSKKEILLHEGDTSKYIYFIEKGLVRSYFDLYGQEKTMWIMKEMDLVVSVISFFSQVKSFETVEAMEDCILWGISYHQLLYIYKNFPEFHVHRAVLLEKYYILSEQRNYIRMQKASLRYKELLENDPALISRIPNKYLASYLGIAEETLSRLRSRHWNHTHNGH